MGVKTIEQMFGKVKGSPVSGLKRKAKKSSRRKGQPKIKYI